MKSLEIVNDIEKHLKDYLDDLKMTKEDFKFRKFSGVEHIFERLEEKISEVQTSMNNAQQIKQDLEVLEILRKVVFKKYQMFYYVSDYGMIDRGFWVSDKSHECTEFELDEEEYNKLKQWLEENENDR